MHTPTPYTANIADTRELEPGKYVREVLISGPHFTPDEMGTAAEDAAFIRKACNMHEELVESVRQLSHLINKMVKARSDTGFWYSYEKFDYDMARALLAKANE